MKILSLLLLAVFFVFVCQKSAFASSDFLPSSLIDPTNIPTDSFGVDIRDIVTYKTKLAPLAQTLLTALKTNPRQFVEANVSFTIQGAAMDPTTRVGAIFGVEITRLNLLAQDGSVESVVLAITYQSSTVKVRHVQVNFEAGKIKNVVYLQEIPVSQLNFQLQVSLIQRKILLRAETQGIFKIYPLGVGGFDMGVYSPGTKIVTNVIADAQVNPKLMADAVFEPDYFMGRPFIVITRSDGRRTGLGFHYSISPKLLRGFVSHGCMRMVDKDLYELFEILRTNGKPINLALLQDSDTEFDHPYPLLNEYHFAVKNFGTPEAPKSLRGKDKLVIMEYVKGPAPIARIDSIVSGTKDFGAEQPTWLTEEDMVIAP